MKASSRAVYGSVRHGVEGCAFVLLSIKMMSVEGLRACEQICTIIMKSAGVVSSWPLRLSRGRPKWSHPLWSANLTPGCATIAALNTLPLISFMMQSDISSFPEKAPHCVYPGSSSNPRSPLMDASDSAAHGSGNPQRQHEEQEVEAVEGNPDAVSLLFYFSYETNLKTFLWSSSNSESFHMYKSILQLWI